MKRSAFILIVSAVLLIMAGALPGRVESREEVWTKATTRHFTLIGNASEKEIRKVGAKLEQFRAAASRLFDFRKRRFSPPVTVIVFKDQSSYELFKPLYQGKPAVVSGYLHSSHDAAYITLTADWQRSEPDRVIFHEYIHFLTAASAGTFPAWLSEGLAEYYSTFAVARGGKQIAIGRPISAHAQLLREGPLLPLETLFTVDHESPYYQESEKKNLFYAQSWALTHYLMAGHGGNRQSRFRQFLSALAEGQINSTGEAEFKQFFLTNLTDLEVELRQYISLNDYPSQTINFDRKIEADESISISPLSRAESQVYLGDLLCRLDRHDESGAMLKSALAEEPGLASAHTSLGLLRIKQGRFAEAQAHLQQAVDANSTNFIAHYSLAFAWQQEFVDSTGYVSGFPPEVARSMRASLNRARQLEPGFPDTLKTLAFINLVQKENLDEAVALIKLALELDPSREDFTFTLAQVYAGRENFSDARQTAESLIKTGANPRIRDRARFLLETIAKRESEAALAKAEEARHLREKNSESGRENDATRLPGKRFTGEQVRGSLTQIECANDHVTLTVVSDSRIFKFRAEPGKLIFVRYTMEIPNQITCGVVSPARQVIVTYRPNSDIKLRFDGEPVGVEFLKADAN